jgi:hypothetical protein
MLDDEFWMGGEKRKAKRGFFDSSNGSSGSWNGLAWNWRNFQDLQDWEALYAMGLSADLMAAKTRRRRKKAIVAGGGWRVWSRNFLPVTHYSPLSGGWSGGKYQAARFAETKKLKYFVHEWLNAALLRVRRELRGEGTSGYDNCLRINRWCHPGRRSRHFFRR